MSLKPSEEFALEGTGATVEISTNPLYLQVESYGMHTGQPVKLRLLPDTSASVQIFCDDESGSLHLLWDTAKEQDSTTFTARNATVLQREHAEQGYLQQNHLQQNHLQLGLTEHFLAAALLFHLDVPQAGWRLEVHGPEIPVLEGSASLWLEWLRRLWLRAEKSGLISNLIQANTTKTQSSLVKIEERSAGRAAKATSGFGAEKFAVENAEENSDKFAAESAEENAEVKSPVSINKCPWFLVAEPASEFSLYYQLELPDLAPQSFQWSANDGALVLAAARTFISQENLRKAQQAGLLAGVQEGHGLLYNPQEFPRLISGGTLRWDNEFARHKALDFLGDLALSGLELPKFRFHIKNGGHWLHQMFLRDFFRESRNERRFYRYSATEC